MRQETDSGFGPIYNPAFAKRIAEKRKAAIHQGADRMMEEAQRKSEQIISDAIREAAAIVERAKIEASMRQSVVQGAVVVPEIDIEPRPVHVIVTEMCQRVGISIAELRGASRARVMVAARRAVIAAVYVERPDMSLPQLARFFRRDHTTLIHAVRKAGVWRGFDRYVLDAGEAR